MKTGKIAFQGALGAYSHEACVNARPNLEPLPCQTFEDVIDTVNAGEADLGMLPIDNSTYGRVADMHRLLPDSGLRIVDETFVRVRISLLAPKGVDISDIHTVRAHLVLLPQSAAFLKAHNINGIAAVDSAGAAEALAQDLTPGEGVLASSLAGHIHGLNVLVEGVEDHGHNTTRFVVMGREDNPSTASDAGLGMVTSFVFRVRNIPAALYKAMGGFATNGVNMTKLESYMVDGSFMATRFYAEIEGHPDDPAVARAMEELRYFTSELVVLGCYAAAQKRH
ncbi:prephenate dehydratase [Halocynthiibacter namhaensis]|uniref:prephenate dehydratase n=1 Tax=Halocynthiibacter namhaensis TaxID=1290553 RepID=UPI0005794A2C|nr:prephenate dehydratase [Halocynthiibacter namhaensis]